MSVPSDEYRVRNWPRVRDEAQFLRRQLEVSQAEVARLNVELQLREHRDRTDVAWLQAKVVAQSRELKRLNDAYNARFVMAGRDPVPDVVVDSITRIEVEARQQDRAEEIRAQNDVLNRLQEKLNQ